MIETLRMKIGIMLARMKYRHAERPVMSFAAALSGAHRALVVMPLDKRELVSSLLVIEMLKRKFSEERITFIGDEHGLEAIRIMPKSHFVQIREGDVNRVYHPRPEFLARIGDKKFDLAIDLNLDLVLPSAYICRESHAPIRIGFVGPQADAFYNFQIQADASRPRKELYDRVARCLHMF